MTIYVIQVTGDDEYHWKDVFQSGSLSSTLKFAEHMRYTGRIAQIDEKDNVLAEVKLKDGKQHGEWEPL